MAAKAADQIVGGRSAEVVLILDVVARIAADAMAATGAIVVTAGGATSGYGLLLTGGFFGRDNAIVVEVVATELSNNARAH